MMTTWTLPVVFVSLAFVYQVKGLSCYVCQYEEGTLDMGYSKAFDRRSFPFNKTCKTGERIVPKFCPENEESQCLNIQFTATKEERNERLSTKVWRRYCRGYDEPNDECNGKLPKHIIVDPSYTITNIRSCYCGDAECNLSRKNMPGLTICILLLSLLIAYDYSCFQQ